LRQSFAREGWATASETRRNANWNFFNQSGQMVQVGGLLRNSAGVLSRWTCTVHAVFCVQLPGQ